ncbi:MAG: hypothetical protein JNJ77_14020 [Planctomycetia bacterium]|nr:hypothetical protein [Planctomycetia bacterium]
MQQLIRFPNQYDVIREEMARFNQFSVDRKFEILADMIQTGLELIELSPNKHIEEQAREKNELAWQQAHQRLFNSKKSHWHDDFSQTV